MSVRYLPEAAAVYEFHGWINVLTHNMERDPSDDWLKAMPAARDAIRTRIETHGSDLAGDWLEVRETTNGQIVVAAHGYRNHRRDYALQLFTWIARKYPHSYGVLYTTDAEDVARDNDFTVYRFARGDVHEMPDRILSPIVPTLRDAAGK